MIRRWIASGTLLYGMMLVAVVEMEIYFGVALLARPSLRSKPLLAGLLVGYAWFQFERHRRTHSQAYGWMLGLMALATLVAR